MVRGQKVTRTLHLLVMLRSDLLVTLLHVGQFCLRGGFVWWDVLAICASADQDISTYQPPHRP